jgi:hypothetical protein
VTTPDEPAARDLAIQEAAAAICPAAHRRGGDAKEPPCGVCYATAESANATAESAINAYVAHLVRNSYYGTLIQEIDGRGKEGGDGDDTEEGR